MKTLNIKKIVSLFYMSALICTALYGKNEEYTKEYSKEYAVTEDTKLNLENKYGNIDVMNWDKELISIHVVIKVNAANEEKAEKLFNQINIEFSQLGNEVGAKTVFRDDFSKIFRNAESNLIDIHYTVNMPKKNPLNLISKYGNVFINEIISTSYIDIKYGNLKANKILHSEEKPFTEILLAYSNADLQNCTWTKFDIKYSKIDIKYSKALIVLSKYSKIFIDNGTSIVTESKYDTYRFGKISNLLATSGYTNFKAEEISNKILMETKYSDLIVGYVPANFQSIKINSSYGNYKIPIDLSASYKIDGYAKYAKIYIPENSKVSKFSENNEFKVQGVVGENANTKSEVAINSQYGNIRLIE